LVEFENKKDIIPYVKKCLPSSKAFADSSEEKIKVQES